MALERVVRSERNERIQRERAVEAETARSRQLVLANQALAAARLRSGLPGHRLDSLAAIASAAAVRPSFELRNEAIATLALRDLGPPRLGPELAEEKSRLQDLPIAFDPDVRRVALMEPDGSIFIHRLLDGGASEVVAHLTVAKGEPVLPQGVLRFSPDGRHLAFRSANGRSLCWQIEPPRLRVDRTWESPSWGSISFTPDGAALLVGDAGSELHRIRSDSPPAKATPPSSPSPTTAPLAGLGPAVDSFRVGITPGAFELDPTGTHWALTDGPTLEVLDPSGR